MNVIFSNISNRGSIIFNSNLMLSIRSSTKGIILLSSVLSKSNNNNSIFIIINWLNKNTRSRLILILYTRGIDIRIIILISVIIRF